MTLNTYTILTDCISVAVIVLCGFPILSARIHTGIFATSGLACFIIAALADLDPSLDEDKIALVYGMGAALLGFAYVLRALFNLKSIKPRKSQTAWFDSKPISRKFKDTHSMLAADDDDQQL